MVELVGTWPVRLGSPGQLGRFNPYARKIGNGCLIQTRQDAYTHVFGFTQLDVHRFESSLSSDMIPLAILLQS